MKHLLNRRKILGILTVCALNLPFSAQAMEIDIAQKMVQKVVDDINTIINSGKSEEAMIDDFRTVFDEYGDVPIIARTTLGVEWRRASASQRTEYVEAFRGYMSRKYGRRFREFIGGTIEIQNTVPVPNGVEVRTLSKIPGYAPFEFSFVVSDGSGKPKFINIYIEGINLLSTERTEIGAMLDQNRGDINLLIAELNTR